MAERLSIAAVLLVGALGAACAADFPTTTTTTTTIPDARLVPDTAAVPDGNVLTKTPSGPAWAVPTGGTGADDQTAAEVPFAPAGGVAATNVQSAIEELDAEKAAAAHSHGGAQVITDTGPPAPTLGNDGDFYLQADTGDVFEKVAGAWQFLQSLVGPPGPAGSGGGNPDFALIPCTGDVTAEIQGAYDTGKKPFMGLGTCTYTTVNMPRSGAVLLGMGQGRNGSDGLASPPNGTRMNFVGSGCSFQTTPGDGDTSGILVAGVALFDQGTGDPTQRHAFCLDGFSNNGVVGAEPETGPSSFSWVRFGGFHDLFHLRGAAADDSAAFYGTIRNIFNFNTRGCVIRAQPNPASSNAIVLLHVSDFDSGRANEGFVCLENTRAAGSNIVIGPGVLDATQTQSGVPMPAAVKITNVQGQGILSLTIEGVRFEGGAVDLVQSDSGNVRVNLIGNTLHSDPTAITYCDQAVDLPVAANDVTCLAAHGRIVSAGP